MNTCSHYNFKWVK